MRDQYIKILITIAFLLSISHASIAQAPGLLGKPLSISFGTNITGSSISPVISYKYHEYLNASYNRKNMPFEYSILLEYSLSLRTSLEAGLSFNPLPDSYFEFTSRTDDQEHSIALTDSFMLRSNKISSILGLRLYKEFSPMGKYYSCSFSANYINSSIYPTTMVKEMQDYIVVNEYIEKLEKGVQFTYSIGLSVGSGRQLFINERLKIDYGYRFNFYFGKGNLTTLERESYRNNIGEVVNFVMNTQLKSNKFFELYFRIGLML